MREFKIFLVVACFTALVYWGVEPYAHSVMKPHVSPANFNFSEEDINFAQSVVDLRKKELELANAELEKAKTSNDAELIKAAEAKLSGAQKSLDVAQKSLDDNQKLWDRVEQMGDLSKGDASKGAEFFATNCYACHGLKSAGLEANIPDSSIYGVLPPDLSSAGLLYDEKFLAALIYNPALALKVDHKFGDAFVMTAYNESIGDPTGVVNENIANVIAYLKEVGKQYDEAKTAEFKKAIEEKYSKIEGLSSEANKTMIDKELAFAKDKNLFIEACGRCHDMKYDSFKSLSAHNDLLGYLGKIPPDLSMMIRSRGYEYIYNFTNNTQKLIAGTAMPRVGLNKESQDRVLSYIEKVGDSKKEERESLGIYIIIFFAILSVFAIAWKRKVWSNLH